MGASGQWAVERGGGLSSAVMSFPSTATVRSRGISQ